MKKTLLFIIAALFISTVNQAQSEDKKWAIGLHGGFAQYNGDLGQGFYDFGQAYYGFGALTLSRYLTSHLDVSLQSSYGDIGYQAISGHFNHTMIQSNLQLKFTFFKYDEVIVRPFLFAGVGILYFDNKTSDNSFNNATLPSYGGGLNFKLSPSFYLQLQETFLYSDYDNVDGESHDAKDSYLLHSLGIVYNIGKMKDEDNDGVSDKKDECPGTPAGVTVDSKGCPVDTDLDGIPDYQDDCPTVPGVASAKGCPDRDGDGIADDKDNCPDDPGEAKFNGCPDRDGDDIIDKEDDCPEDKGLAEFQGCPDRDGDQIIDKEDACPDDPGLAEFQGCPDADGDGIIDKQDLCPEIPGVIENNGCPEIKEEVKAVLENAVYGIRFDFGKSSINKSSFKILDEVAKIMLDNPYYKLKIDGHTDSKGNDDFNMKLSEERAASVEKYLEGKGIDEDRIYSKGYGETMPVGDNDTEEGRAKNRRVELIIEF
ncbi:MAG: OmpA family protein [Bacteroidales bacterium]|nr:OmpA family protein [Bacteroidales bacterium]